MSNIITVSEMQEGKIYKTCESDLSYFAKYIGKKDAQISLSVLMQKSGKWKEIDVPSEYKVRELTDDEIVEFETLNQPKQKKVRVPKDPNQVKTSVAKVVGAISGKGMIASWAHYINEFVGVEGGRTKVIEAMTAEFPTKVDSINKWVDAYLTYYNSGRFSKFGFEKRTEYLRWILSESEKNEGIKIRKNKKSKKENTQEVEKGQEVVSA